MMMGVQSGPILSPDTLNELRDVVTGDMTAKPSITTWNAKRDEFTAKATPIVQRGIALERLNDFRVIDVNFTHDPNATWKLKLNVDFRNETGIPIDANQPTWAMSIGGLPQKDGWSGIQLRQPDGTWEATRPRRISPMGENSG